jgi:hypothetical protein
LVRRIASCVLAAGSPLIVVAALAGGAVSDWTLGLLAVLFPVVLIVRGCRRGRLGLAFGALVATLCISAVALLSLAKLPPERVPWWFGLPASAWIMLVGLCLVPMVLVVAIHARSFDPRHE